MCTIGRIRRRFLFASPSARIPSVPREPGSVDAHPLSILSLLVALAAVIGCVGSVHGEADPARRLAEPAPRGLEAPRAAESQRSDSELIARLGAIVAEREYGVGSGEEGLQAPNRAHALRTHFDSRGIRVRDREAARGQDLLRLELKGFGRASALRPTSAGTEVVASGNRVEIRRPGLVEWYVNSAEGLEQGFTLANRPAGAGSLTLEIAVEGAKPVLLEQDAIVFETGKGRRLRYAELLAFDAEGRDLEARFALSGSDRSRIQLIVDDSGATYPIVIDPLLTEVEDASIESDQFEARLGVSVAGAGDVNGDGYDDVIVGANLYDAGQVDEGAAFVFHGGPSGIATAGAASAATQLESNQSSSFGDSPPGFGISVSGAGDVNGDGYDDVIVGSPLYNAGELDEGAAFVFLGGPAGIPDGSPATAATQLESNLAVSSGFPFIPATSFARNVSGAGDVNGDGYADVLVGATGYDAGQTNEGAVFVFLGSPAGIADGNPATAAARLESNQANAGLGSSLSSAGDVNSDGHADVIVGADSYLGRGAAFVFLGSGSGPSNANPSTPGVTELVSTQTGSAFGTSVSAAGDVDGDGFGDVIVGASSYDTSGSDEGSAFIFRGGATGIADGNELIASRIRSDQTGARLGQSVSGLGDVNGDGYGDVAVGAHQYDSLSVNDGAVFVFLGRPAGLPSGLPTTAYAHLDVGQSEAWMGWTVAGAGDVNGDGYADVLAGATLFDAGQTNEGRAYLHRGGALGLSGAANASPQTLASDQLLGPIVMQAEPAGDVNGDGFGDVLVSRGPLETTSTVLSFGASTGFVTNPTDPLRAPQDLPGATVASAGDVNGDGYGDVIVGVPTYDGGETDEGAALLFLGSAAGIPEDAGGDPILHARIESNQAGAKLGAHVASAGDVNGDGYGDVVVVAVGYDAGQVDEGAAFVFLGSPTGIANGSPATAHARLEVDQPGIAFFPGDPSTNSMLTVAGSAGDVNGDGFGDVVIVAPKYASPEYNEGAAFVFLGSASGIANGNPANAHARFETNQPEGDPSSFPNYGVLEEARSAGDLNRDGFDDLVLGAPRYSNGQLREGAVFVLFGSATGLENASPATADARFESDQANASVGSRVDAAGDVDGDGFGDLVVSGNSFAFVPQQPIWAFVLRGSATGIVPQDPFGFLHGVVGTAEDTRGVDVAGAGDVNGDGFGDVIVQAVTFAPLEPSSQAVFSYLAHSAGHSILPTQRRGDGSGIRVQRGGSAASADRFEVELFARSPRGRELSKLEVEVCPTGVAFGDSLGCTKHESPGWIDLGSSGATVAASVTGLESGAAHSWRARLRFTPYRTSPPGATAPVVVGPWFRLGARTSIGDIRTVPEPGIGSGLLVGALLLGAWRGRARAATGRGAAHDRDRVARMAGRT